MERIGAMDALRRYAAVAGAALLAGAGGVALARPESLYLRSTLLGAGVLLLLVGLFANLGAVRGLLSRRAARYGAGTAVVILLGLGVAVLANAVSIRYHTRWDLTENRRHSLSPQTIKILQGLTEPVEAIAFFRTDTPGKRAAEDLFKQYASYSRGKFSWRTEDPDRAPGLARRYGVETYGTVVLERGTKSEKILDAEEEKLTNGLVKVTREGKRVVFVVKGHGEHEIGSADRPGFSEAKTQLERANYEVRELTLARDPKVPEEAAVVLVPGPRTDLLPPELGAIDAYLSRGGKVLFMLAPFQAEGLRPYLAKYGFEVGDNLVIESNPIGRIFGVGPEVPIVTQYDPHPITRELGGVMTLFPLTRSVEPMQTAPAGVSLQALARTSPQSWGETDRAALNRGVANQDEKDRRGPLTVAVVATLPAKEDAAGAGGAAPSGGGRRPRARIVVVGSSSLASNQFIGAQGNRDFFLNAVSWLAEDEDLLSVRAKDARQQPILLTSAQSQLVFWLPVVVLPGVMALLGIGVVVKRRRSR
jgi:ABC-type uncharacterized transport system involved in gliding motility auxiliary subunit